MFRPTQNPRSRGSALVTTLLVIVVLAVIVTAFLQSMTTERQTAKSYLSHYQAENAATAAQNDAIYLVRNLFTKYPDSVTWWDPNLADQGVAGTVFSYYATEAATDSTKAIAANSFYVPLASGATSQLQSAKDESLHLDGTEVDLNSLNTRSLLENGERWIGSVPNQTAPVIKVPWVYLKDNTPAAKRIARYAFWIEDESFRVNVNVAGKTIRGLDTPGTSPKEIPMQGAFTGAGITQEAATTLAGNVVDMRTAMDPADEKNQKILTTSQINYTFVPPKDDDFKKSRFLLTLNSSGSNLSRTGSRRMNLNALNAASIPAKNTIPDVQADIDKIKAAINYRPETSAASDYQFGNRFYRTLPDVQNTEVVTNDAATPNREIYVTKIAANIRDYIDVDSSPTQVDTLGNVKQAPPTLPVGGKFTIGFPAVTNLFWAIGQENVPRLTKTMVHVAQLTPMTKVTSNPDKKISYKIRISYYLEFWNMGTKTIKVGTGSEVSDEHTTYLDKEAFIRIGNQPAWEDYMKPGEGIPVDRPYNIELNTFPGLEFAPGTLTVLTTDPAYASSSAFLHFDPLSSATPKRIFLTTKTLDTPAFQLFDGFVVVPNNGPNYGKLGTLDCILRNSQGGRQDSPVSQPKEDVGTYVLLGDSAGILDSQRAAVSIKPGIFIDGFGDKNTTSTMHFRGGTLPGNLPTGFDMATQTHGAYSYMLGDPRASCDPLGYAAGSTQKYGTPQPVDSPVFTSWRSDDYTVAASKQSSSGYRIYSVMGFAKPPPGSNVGPTSGSQLPSSVNPFDVNPIYRWDDAGASLDLATMSATETYKPGSLAVIADANLKNIGELGNIYDPAFYTSGLPQYARGGGRTLRIGQSETPRFANDPASQWDGNEFSASRSRVAWRLCDIFATNDLAAVPGTININGIQRDNGSALLAALNGFSMSGKDTVDSTRTNGEGELNIDKKALSDNGKTLVAELIDYIKNSGNDRPLRERGELSELSFFNRSSPQNRSLVDGVTFNSEMDRSREQLFRRLSELITTKGNVFTAYVVGQALNDTKIGVDPQVISSVKRKITFQLIPKFEDPKLDSNDSKQINDWTANSSTDPDIKRRFKAPVNYDIEILQVTN